MAYRVAFREIEMTEISRPKINFMLLAASLVLGTVAVVVCWLTRMFLMKSTPDWLTIDYTVLGWILRTIAA